MPGPIDIFAPQWSAFVRGDGGSLDSIFAYSGLLRVLGKTLGATVSERPVGRHVVIRSVTAEAATSENSFAEDLLAFGCRPEPLRGSQARGVFCPSRLQGEVARETIGDLYRVLTGAGEVLYLPEHPRDLDSVAVAGPATLFSPRSPDLHVRAVGSAAWLVSYRPLPALAALGAGIPTLWIAETEADRRLAAHWGVKAWTPEETTAPRILDWVKTAARTSVQIPASRLGEWKNLEALTEPSTIVIGEPPCFASISSADYVPFLEGYVANVLDHHPGARLCFYILALDGGVEAPMRKRFGDLCDLRIFRLTDFWTEAQMPEIRNRSVGVRAFSTKPRLIHRALLETGRPVFYTDSDVHFFETSTAFIEEFSASGALLFPHWNDDFLCSRKDGIFNAGMVVGYPRAVSFFDWWAKRCWENANFNRGDGVVADQGYLDFGPALFESVHPYRRGDHDVARWNLHSLGVHWDQSFPPQARVAGGPKIKTFHAAFVDSAGLGEVKFAWDTANYFFSPSYVAAQTPAPLMELTLQQQANHWLTLSRWLKLVEKLSFAGGRRAEWLGRATGPWGRKILGWLSRSREVAWSSAAPTLPLSTDPWILAHKEYFKSECAPPELHAIKRRA